MAIVARYIAQINAVSNFIVIKACHYISHHITTGHTTWVLSTCVWPIGQLTKQLFFLRKPTLYIEHQSIEPDVVFRTFVDTTRPGISTVEGLESTPETVQVGLSW